jgi:hypothetical protein
VSPGRPAKCLRSPGARGGVAPDRRPVDIRAPPTEFDPYVDWFEAVSYRLVLLEPYALRDIEEMIHRTQHVLTSHMREEISAPAAGSRAADRELREVLASDHRWFLRSVEQLGWFLGIVVAEDHGGHRQALGQYGRILAEAVVRHRRDERRYLERHAPAVEAGLGAEETVKRFEASAGPP